MTDRQGRAQGRVVITGIGIVCAHGANADGMFSLLMEGKSAIALNPVGLPPYASTIASGRFPEEGNLALAGQNRAAALDRVSQLALLAAESAWRDAQLGEVCEQQLERTCVLMGTAVGGAQSTERAYRELFLQGRPRLSPLTILQSMHNAAASHVANRFGLGGSCMTYSMACASSAAAIADGARRIRAGECSVALAGGSEAAQPFGIVKAWQAMRVLAPAHTDADARRACRPFAMDRAGMVLGEGAAVLVLEERQHALARGARIYAELAGVGSSSDPRHLTGPAVDGQVRALRGALRDACCNPSDVAYVNAHGTALAEGDRAEVKALCTLFGDHARSVAVSATKSMLGHMLGASGAVEAAITAMAIYRRQWPPTAHTTVLDPACIGVDHVLHSGRDSGPLTLALSSSFAFGGSNVVLAFAEA